jgi:hypothetical protein
MAKLTPLIKALRLAIKDLKYVCHERYTASAQADIYGFEFAKKAREHYNEHQEAVKILQSMLDKLEKRPR